MKKLPLTFVLYRYVFPSCKSIGLVPSLNYTALHCTPNVMLALCDWTIDPRENAMKRDNLKHKHWINIVSKSVWWILSDNKYIFLISLLFLHFSFSSSFFNSSFAFMGFKYVYMQSFHLCAFADGLSGSAVEPINKSSMLFWVLPDAATVLDVLLVARVVLQLIASSHCFGYSVSF